METQQVPREKVEEIRQVIAARSGTASLPRTFAVHTDTSDFFKIGYNDVLLLGERIFWVKSYEKEGRFGLDDEPKYWVRRAVDLGDGSSKILKMVFHEEFVTRLAGVSIKCFRSPRKEGRILDLVAGHKNFMHGCWLNDAAGNNIRILEYIVGPRFDAVVAAHQGGHEEYFYTVFPGLLDQYIELVEAIGFLHAHGEKHGDIRRDHILFDSTTKTNRWIDFDYNYLHGEAKWSFDLQGLGNIAIFLVGRGDVLVDELYHRRRDCFETLWGEDLNISYANRVANLRKIYPYIPESLNRVLLHFSKGATLFYDSTRQMLEDLAAARAEL